jgi:hypothetical protein
MRRSDADHSASARPVRPFRKNPARAMHPAHLHGLQPPEARLAASSGLIHPPCHPGHCEPAEIFIFLIKTLPTEFPGRTGVLPNAPSDFVGGAPRLTRRATQARRVFFDSLPAMKFAAHLAIGPRNAGAPTCSYPRVASTFLGDTPKRSLKARLKCAGLRKPHRYAISCTDTGRTVLARNRRSARSSRACQT